jgi:hypothetical protein
VGGLVTQTNLLKLASDAGLWPVTVEDATTLRVDGGVIRFGAGIPESDVAAFILEHQLAEQNGASGHPAIASELTNGKFVGPSLRRAVVAVASPVSHLRSASAH